MGFNEILLVITALVSALLVLIAWKVNRERLYSVIIVFLILISIIGGKIVIFFGHETNTGNIFYASVFLATYFIIERYGKHEGIRSIWIGVTGVVFFSVLLRLVIATIGSGETGALDVAFSVAFSPALRLALASLAGYTVSQTVNVYLYVYLKLRYPGKYLWLRANTCNVISQVIDSLIFFTVAFIGTIPPTNVLDIILTGFLIKVAYIMLTSPFLYLNRKELNSDGTYASVAIW